MPSFVCSCFAAALAWIALAWIALAWIALAWIALAWIALAWIALAWMALAGIALAGITQPASFPLVPAAATNLRFRACKYNKHEDLSFARLHSYLTHLLHVSRHFPTNPCLKR
jgi:hypothetical protein